ncbi:hypothetical protein OQA88_3574 [Cercophora sp. LCS_1]
MMRPVLLLASPVVAVQYKISSSIPGGNDVFDSFMSYSIELSSFPDFAGNKSHPNTYSYNLLKNLAAISGSMPYIRVGGNTQDYALYNASLPYAINGTVDPKRSPDYPTTIHIGPSFFESYSTWPGSKFSHGLNLGLGGNNSVGWQSLLETVPQVCKALRGKLYIWQYGNEPDLFSTSSQGPVRPPTWNESTYVWQWKNGTRAINGLVTKHCPELLSSRYLAPAFGGASNKLKLPLTMSSGLNSGSSIRLLSVHNYISGATSPGVTLQGTLMNHTVTIRSINAHITNYKLLSNPPPLIFGEHNSLYNQGRPGLSNTFGAALWSIDFNLFSAALSVRRVHMHMGTNYRYASWQPITTSLSTVGTRPAYYANIFVASFLGDLTQRRVSISCHASSSETEVVYAAYTNNGTALSRVAVVNMRGHNGSVEHPRVRGIRKVEIGVEGMEGKEVGVRRLTASGSDATEGVRFDGWRYEYQDSGRAVREDEPGETAKVEGGVVTIEIENSGALILDFEDDGNRYE